MASRDRPAFSDVLAVNAGDVVLLHSTWSGVAIFKVADVREPSDPRAGGVVWEGYYWRWHDADEGPHWSPRRVLHLIEDNWRHRRYQGLAGPGDVWTFGVPTAGTNLDGQGVVPPG